jgi:hypothetical protein
LVDPVAYARALVDFKEPKAIPVAVADESTALRILGQFRESRHRARLIFSLNNHSSVQKERRDLPEYLMSLSVRRTNTQLVEYLSDALRLFLQTEIQTVATYYLASRREFERLVIENYPTNGPRDAKDAQAKLRKAAEEWTTYTFRVDDKDIELYQDFEVPWRPILRRALEIEEENSPRKSAAHWGEQCR